MSPCTKILKQQSIRQYSIYSQLISSSLNSSLRLLPSSHHSGPKLWNLLTSFIRSIATPLNGSKRPTITKSIQTSNKLISCIYDISCHPTYSPFPLSRRWSYKLWHGVFSACSLQNKQVWRGCSRHSTLL